MCKLLTMIVHPYLPGLAWVPRCVRPTRGTSSMMLRSVTRTLYSVGFTCQILNERLFLARVRWHLPQSMCCRTQLDRVIHKLGQMNPNGSIGYLIQLSPIFRFVCGRNFVVLYRVDLATDYEIVQHLLLLEVQVCPIELPETDLGWVGC
jgi:hypothetical protein